MAVSEPSPRLSAFAGASGGKAYLWGGSSEKLRGTKELAANVHLFDPLIERWLNTTPREYPPSFLDWASCAHLDDHLYAFRETDGSAWQGSLNTFRWTEVASPDLCGPMMNRSGAMRKSGYGTVVHGEKLVVFGGWSGSPGSVQPGSECMYGYTNELHTLDLRTKVWSSPRVTGARPPPCKDFTLTRIGNNRAVLFGGFQPGHVEWKSCDVYLLDLISMHWSKITRQGREPWPEGRTHHIAVCLGCEGKHAQLLVTGGSDKNNNVLSDAWLLDLQSWKWKKLPVSNKVVERINHCATPLVMSPEIVEVVLFGGRRGTPLLAETAVLQFELLPSTGKRAISTRPSWVLTDVADHHQLGSSERVRLNKASGQTRGEDNNDHESQIPCEKAVDVRGFISVGETSATYTGESMDLKWDDYGLEMHFEEGELPSGVDECPVQVSAATSGEFEFPKDTEPASGVYKIDCPIELNKPVTIKIQHCASDQSIGGLRFASCSNYSPPYNYHLLDGGKFTSGYGEIGIDKFSYLYTILYNKYGEDGVLSILQKSYLVSLHCSREPFVESPSRLSWSLYFSIVKNCIIFQKCIDSFFAGCTLNGAVDRYADMTVKFKKDAEHMELKGIVESGGEIQIQSGWSVISLVPCLIEKCDIDYYVDGRPPLFRLLLKQNSDKNPSDLMYKFILEGVEDPQSFIRLCKPVAEHKQNDMGPSLETLYRRYVSKIPEAMQPKLDEDITTDLHVRRIAEVLVGWDEKCDLLKLRWIPDVHDIKNGPNKDNLKLQRIEALNLWRNKCTAPTYNNLLRICVKGNFRDSAEVIVLIISESNTCT